MEKFSDEKIDLLRHNARSVVRELGLLNDAYFEIGVTLAERHLLIELPSCSCPTMGEIAERLLLDKSTASRLIAKAMKKGYIKSTLDSSENLGDISIKLSQKGLSLTLFKQEDENSLYDIFRNVVDSGIEFPYESNSIQEFYRQFFAPSSKVYVCRSSNEIVGGFYIRPNFSGRCNHIANAA